MNKIAALLEAMRYGAELADPAAWKRRQTAVNALVACIGASIAAAAACGVRIEATSEDVAAIAGGVATLVAVFNKVLTLATSKKIGIGKP